MLCFGGGEQQEGPDRALGNLGIPEDWDALHDEAF